MGLMMIFDFNQALATIAGGMLFPMAVGLGSSFTHCAGMCGPIHLFLAAKGGHGNGIWLYHAGRITGYALLGAFLGALGQAFSGLSSPAFRISAGFALAVLYTLFGLGMLGWLPSRMNLERRLSFLFPARLMGRLSASASNRRILFPAGLMASLLPCPSTHAVLLWSLGLGHAWKSALAMVLLGICTLPVFAVLRNGIPFRSAWSGRAYQTMLGVLFLGLSAWRIYGIATLGPAHCH
jgi:uncharacterized protein